MPIHVPVFDKEEPVDYLDEDTEFKIHISVHEEDEEPFSYNTYDDKLPKPQPTPIHPYTFASEENKAPKPKPQPVFEEKLEEMHFGKELEEIKLVDEAEETFKENIKLWNFQENG